MEGIRLSGESYFPGEGKKSETFTLPKNVWKRLRYVPYRAYVSFAYNHNKKLLRPSKLSLIFGPKNEGFFRETLKELLVWSCERVERIASLMGKEPIREFRRAQEGLVQSVEKQSLVLHSRYVLILGSNVLPPLSHILEDSVLRESITVLDDQILKDESVLSREDFVEKAVSSILKLHEVFSSSEPKNLDKVALAWGMGSGVPDQGFGLKYGHSEKKKWVLKDLGRLGVSYFGNGETEAFLKVDFFPVTVFVLSERKISSLLRKILKHKDRFSPYFEIEGPKEGKERVSFVHVGIELSQQKDVPIHLSPVAVASHVYASFSVLGNTDIPRNKNTRSAPWLGLLRITKQDLKVHKSFLSLEISSPAIAVCEGREKLFDFRTGETFEVLPKKRGEDRREVISVRESYQEYLEKLSEGIDKEASPLLSPLFLSVVVGAASILEAHKRVRDLREKAGRGKLSLLKRKVDPLERVLGKGYLRKLRDLEMKLFERPEVALELCPVGEAISRVVQDLSEKTEFVGDHTKEEITKDAQEIEEIIARAFSAYKVWLKHIKKNYPAPLSLKSPWEVYIWDMTPGSYEEFPLARSVIQGNQFYLLERHYGKTIPKHIERLGFQSTLEFQFLPRFA